MEDLNFIYLFIYLFEKLNIASYYNSGIIHQVSI